MLFFFATPMGLHAKKPSRKLQSIKTAGKMCKAQIYDENFHIKTVRFLHICLHTINRSTRTMRGLFIIFEIEWITLNVGANDDWGNVSEIDRMIAK